MVDEQITTLSEIAKNEKRLFILRELVKKTDLTWTEIVRLIDKEFGIRVNPNTVGFHLKYLLDRDYIRKIGSHYILNDRVKQLVGKLVE